MHSFHFIVYLLCAQGVREIADTQCGFKLFSRKSAQLIFPYMHVTGWIFDIEVLHLACVKGIEIRQVPVTWTEVDGSKMSLVKDSMKMALDLFVIRLNYAVGLW